MKIKDYRCKCGHDNFFLADKGTQKGIYCSYCGKWLKWADKDEQNLVMKHELILDKVRAEIEQHRRKTQSIDPYDLVGDCLDIIDKYKKETEDT